MSRLMLVLARSVTRIDRGGVGAVFLGLKRLSGEPVRFSADDTGDCRLIEHDPLFAQDHPRGEHYDDEREWRSEERREPLTEPEVPVRGEHHTHDVRGAVAMKPNTVYVLVPRIVGCAQRVAHSRLRSPGRLRTIPR